MPVRNTKPVARIRRSAACTLLAALLLAGHAWAAVDLNLATLSELEAVKGIGPVKARAIVEYRREHGPFRNIESLARVRGFGPASVAKLKKKLTCAAPRP